jgi:hypothetical protein
MTPFAAHVMGSLATGAGIGAAIAAFYALAEALLLVAGTRRSITETIIRFWR